LPPKTLQVPVAACAVTSKVTDAVDVALNKAEKLIIWSNDVEVLNIGAPKTDSPADLIVKVLPAPAVELLNRQVKVHK
jgi:hypothetical protein